MAIADEEEAGVLEVLRAKRLFRYYGPGETESKASQLERAFAEKKGTRYAVAVTSGTAALVCGLQGIGIGPGDEVIVPAYTWIASAAAIVAAGGDSGDCRSRRDAPIGPCGRRAQDYAFHQGDHAGAYARRALPDG